MTWTIEKGIPIPPRGTRSSNSGRQKGLVEALRQCEVDDSILVPDLDTAQAVLSYVKTAHGIKTTRRLVDGGVRVWRVG